MEILFQNEYAKDKEWAKAAYSYISFRRPIIIVLDIFMALCLVFGIYNFDLYFILLPIIWVACQFLMYYKSISNTIKRDTEVHGKPIEVIATVTDENIKMVQSTGAELHLNYWDIKKVIDTKKYIYLLTNAKLLWCFKKDAFSIGNEQDFLPFLKSKGVKLKI